MVVIVVVVMGLTVGMSMASMDGATVVVGVVVIAASIGGGGSFGVVVAHRSLTFRVGASLIPRAVEPLR
jgi:hypothetical protein